MSKWCMNYDSGEYEDIDEDGYSWTRGEYVYNWDNSEYEREREEEERIVYTYQVFTLFFIPVWRWNKTYFAETTCCHKQFILDRAVGDLLRNGEDVEIVDSDLSEIY